MRFVFKKKVLSSIMAATMAAGFAASQNAAAIHLAEDHVGQVLLAPIYLATAGYNTQVTIVNTREDVAVKARIAIRSAGSSQEVKDFICYLTPADVCKFEIRKPDGSFIVNGKDMPYIWSDDDSMKAEDAAPPKFASQIVGGLKSPLDESRMALVDPNDSSLMGHIEVVGTYAAVGNVVTSPIWNSIQQAVSVVNVRREMSKVDVARIFDTPRTITIADLLASTFGLPAGAYSNVLNILNVPESPTMATGRMINGVCQTTPANSGITLNDGANVPCSPGVTAVDVANIRSTDPRVVRLTGTARMISASDRMAYKIPALAGEIWDQVDPDYTVWENSITDPSGVGGVGADALPAGVQPAMVASRRLAPAVPPTTQGRGAGFDGRVVAYSDFDATVAGEVGLGLQMGFAGAHNTLEIEHALAVSSIKNEYEDDGFRFEGGVSKPGNKRTQLMVTFPTKYMHRGQDVCNTYLQHQVATGGLTTAQAAITYSVPFTPQGKVGYSLTAYDNQEHSQAVTRAIVFSPFLVSSPLELPAEVNYFVPTWPTTNVGQNNYESGWFALALSQKTQSTHFNASVGCDYAGVPTLSLSHNYLLNASGISNSWLSSNAHSQELVNRQYNWKAQDVGVSSSLFTNSY